jgi:hypothetical protein
VTNTAGDWLLAFITWRPFVTGSGVSVCVADDAHNWWEPVGSPLTDSDARGTVRAAVWAAPAARVANTVTGVTNIQVAATGPVLSLACTIVDFSGLLPWYQVAMTPGSNYGNAVTSLALSAGAPSATALLLTAFASDNNSDTVTGPAGWTALTTSSASNGVDHTADVKLTPAWKLTASSSSASVSSSGSLDLAGVIAGVLVSAPQPAQPNPYWPAMVTEVAIGSGAQTPPGTMTWTPLSARSLSLSARQGKSYSLGALQAGQGVLVADDPDGALIPPGTGSFAGIDSGTPVRRRVTWPGLPGGTPNPSPNYVTFSGFIRRWPWAMDPVLYRGKVQAEVADVWAYGTGALNSMATEECLLDSPHSLWPATDPAGSTGASNLVPGGVPLTQVTSKYGPGGATATWGANSGALIGASSAKVTQSGASGGSAGMWQQQLSGISLGVSNYGYCLQAYDPGYPAISGGVTVECFAQVQADWLLSGMSFNVGVASPGSFAFSSSVPAGSAVQFTVAVGFTFPTGITAGQTYYVVGNGGTSGVNVSDVPGGTPVSISGAGSGFAAVVLPWDPVIMSARDGKGTVFEFSVRNTDGALLVTYRPASATGTWNNAVADAGRDYRAAPLWHYSLAVTTTTWRMLVNGGSILAASGSFISPIPGAFREICYAGVFDSTETGNVMPGCIGFAGVYPGISPQARVISRASAALTGLAGEAACDRVERALEYAGLAGRRWLGQQAVTYEGDLVASGRDVGGTAAVSVISNIAASTLPAMAYVAPTGDVVYHSKLYAWNEPVRWTLGDDTAAGEIPFTTGSLATDYDPARVTGSVQLTQLDTQSVTVPSGVMSSTTMAAVAAAAGTQYGGSPYQQTGYLDLDWSSAYNGGSSLQDLANWVQAVYRAPQNRVQSVTVDAAAHPAAWPFWCGASVGDMVTVSIRVPTATTSPLISLTARITQTSRSSQFGGDTGGKPSATIQCALDFAPEYRALVCDDPVRGALDGSNLLSW